MKLIICSFLLFSSCSVKLYSTYGVIGEQPRYFKSGKPECIYIPYTKKKKLKILYKMKYGVIEKTNDGLPILLDKTVKPILGEFVFLDGEVLPCTQEIFERASAILLDPILINEDIVYKLEQGELEYGDVVAIYYN